MRAATLLAGSFFVAARSQDGGPRAPLHRASTPLSHVVHNFGKLRDGPAPDSRLLADNGIGPESKGIIAA
ncbi:MAG: hypothetical protein WBV40_08480 [Candidatus Cybelea sp.]